MHSLITPTLSPLIMSTHGDELYCVQINNQQIILVEKNNQNSDKQSITYCKILLHLLLFTKGKS